MSPQKVIADPVDFNEKWLYRFGGASTIILVAGYLLTFPIYAWVGDAPSGDVEAQLVYFAGHSMGWWAILGLMVFTSHLTVLSLTA